MATFDDSTVGTSTGGTTPDYGARSENAPKILQVDFGDGYEQRLTYGLNQDPQNWTLTWTAKDETDADAIESFFSARGGKEAFDWTPLGASSSSKFVCDSWQRNYKFSGVNEISAQFRQVFES